MIFDMPNKSIQEQLESILFRYQDGLETAIKSSDYIYDCVNFLY